MFLARRVFKRCRDERQRKSTTTSSNNDNSSNCNCNNNNNRYNCNDSSNDDTHAFTAKACYYPPPNSPCHTATDLTQQPSIVDDDEIEDDDDDSSMSLSYEDSCYDVVATKALLSPHKSSTNDALGNHASQDHTEASATYMEQPARKRYRVDNTPFPQLYDSAPEAEMTDTSSDDESVRQRHANYEAQTANTSADVQMFMILAARMSLASLLHLLQGAARAQLEVSPEAAPAMEEYNYLLAGNRKPSNIKHSASASKFASSTSVSNAPGYIPAIVKRKQFRFAEVSNHAVRCVVHHVESYKQMSRELWWTNEEMMAIRYEQVRVVRHFRKHVPSYIQSVETLVAGRETPAVLEQHMRRLTEGADAFARGLETHAVRCIAERRKSHVQAVLQEQADCVEDQYDVASVCLREQSIAYSAMLAAYAYRMAQCDALEALKASMSPWEKPTAQQSPQLQVTQTPQDMATN